MKKSWIGCLCLVLVSVWVSGAAAPTESPGKGPVISLPDGRFQFEPVVEGTQVTHKFIVRNTGDAPLNIERVRTG